MARIALTHRRSLPLRLAEAYSRRRYGAVLEPGLAMLHNRKVLLATIANENKVARWDTLDPTVKALAVLASASEIGCSWCIDFGFWESVNSGVDPAKLQAVPDWPTAAVYSGTERAAMAYAVAMTKTPPDVSDDMVEDLRMRFSDAQLVELTAMIAQENQRSRINAALGLSSQGFKDFCDLPAPGSDDRSLSARTGHSSAAR